jgi:replicative DNA helicase
MLYRAEYYKDEIDNGDDESRDGGANKVEVIVAKNRHGPTKTVELIWDSDHTLFVSMERVRNDM